MRLPILTLLTVATLPLLAQADIYRWVDANGGVHFSESAPQQGNYQQLNPETSPTGADSGVTSAGKFLGDKGKRDAAAGKAQQVATQAKAESAEKCAKARERIANLEEKTAHRLMVKGPDGQPARMTDEQFDQELKTAQQNQAKFCN